MKTFDQRPGIAKLDLAFGLSPAGKANMIARQEVIAGDPPRYLSLKSSIDTRPVRTRPGCPPVRDAEHRRKHKARKRAHESRRRNR